MRERVRETEMRVSVCERETVREYSFVASTGIHAKRIANKKNVRFLVRLAQLGWKVILINKREPKQEL